MMNQPQPLTLLQKSLISLVKEYRLENTRMVLEMVKRNDLPSHYTYLKLYTNEVIVANLSFLLRAGYL